MSANISNIYPHTQLEVVRGVRMHHIIVGVDGSDWSEIAAHYALDIAMAGKDDITAVGIIPPDVMATLEEEPASLAFSTTILPGPGMGQRAVNDWFEKTEHLCENAGICFGRTIEVGDAAERLPILSLNSRLTVFGVQGATPEDRRIGRVAMSMLDHAIKPMLVTKSEYSPITKVVVGWDGRAEAAHAAEMAFSAAKASGWELVIVAGAPETAHMAGQARFVAEQMNNSGVKTKAIITNGDAPDVVLDVADEVGAGLIAIGARRKTMTQALLTGSAWLQILELTDVPVLLYR